MPSDRWYRRTPLRRSWPTFFAAYFCSEETLLRLCTRGKLYAITDFLCSGSYVQSSFCPTLRFLIHVSVVPCVLARAGVSMSSPPVPGTQAVTNLFFCDGLKNC